MSCESWNIKKLPLYFFSGLFFVVSLPASSESNCDQYWSHPVSQRMEMRGMTWALDDYAENEFHFSIKQANHTLDIYLLKNAILVKGPARSDIEHYSEDELEWLPNAFAIPNAVLSAVAPKGFCIIHDKTHFSQVLTKAVGYGQHKLTQVDGDIISLGQNQLGYKFSATVVPPLDGISSIEYSGSMRFAEHNQPLAAGTRLTGYTVLGVGDPAPIIGSASLHLSTLAELRIILARQEPMDQDDEDDEGLRF